MRAREDGLAAAGEDGDAVPRFFAAPDRAITRLLERGFGKLRIRRLKLLQRDDVGLGAAQPREQVGEPVIRASASYGLTV